MPDNTEDINIQIYRGDTKDIRFMVKNSAGIAYDLTGFTIRSQARLSADSEETLFDITVEDGYNGSDFSTGIVVLRIPADDTADLPPSCVYDIQAESSSMTFTIAKGRLVLRKDVTR